MEVESWIKQIHKIFRVIGEQKVPFATFILEDDANHWWEMTER